MNYFAHGREYVDAPYFLAGTAVPDWLSVIDRRMRARAKLASPFQKHDDERFAAIASGIVRHHFDDAWFHQTRAFAELSLQLTVAVRDALPRDDGLRPSFLGHIMVEILLDACLIVEDTGRLDAYYRAMQAVDPRIVERAVNQMATRKSDKIAVFIPLFCAERFLYDYPEDEKLLSRLNRVMRRVKLAPLPNTLLDVLPEARQAVSRRREELLSGPVEKPA